MQSRSRPMSSSPARCSRIPSALGSRCTYRSKTAIVCGAARSVIYRINDQTRTVTVLAIMPRADAYRAPRD
jgi:hypothetical protein